MVSRFLFWIERVMEMIDRNLLKKTCRASAVTFVLGYLVLCRMKVHGAIWICTASSIPAAVVWTRLISHIFDWAGEKLFIWRMSQEVKIEECESEEIK